LQRAKHRYIYVSVFFILFIKLKTFLTALSNRASHYSLSWQGTSSQKQFTGLFLLPQLAARQTPIHLCVGVFYIIYKIKNFLKLQ